MVARDLPVVRVHAAVAVRPAIKLRTRDRQMREDPPRGQLRARAERAHIVDDGVAGIGRHPSLPQLSPRLFLSARCSAAMNAMTASFFATFASGASMRARALLLPAGRAAVLERGAQVLEGLPLPEAKQGGLDPVLVTQVRHRHAIDQVATENRRLVLRREPPSLPLFLAVRFARRLLQGPTVKCGAGRSHISTGAGVRWRN